MKYLVTGASGFAGRYLIRELAEAGHEVIGVVRRAGSLEGEQVTEAMADLYEPRPIATIVAEHQPDGIFHLAAPETSPGRSWSDPAGVIDANLATTLNVLEAARRADTIPTVLMISSSEVLGDATDGPADESVTPHPVSPYGASKLLDEQAAHFYTEQLKVPIIIVRPFNHVGPGQSPRLVLPTLASQIAACEQTGAGEVRVGNLEARRDFTDVRDMAKAYILLMDKAAPGEVYHAGSGEAHSIQELLDVFIEASPATIKVVPDPDRMRPVDIPLLQADPGKLHALGWQPQIPLKQTLADILADAREQLTQRSTDQ